ncbi:hypothetical protein PYW08_010262 [Mythimna loreyi]|uniref:Uncharacterized protein n=1 Tax=Mythimna loreyi TaxID=667449 RepID=A0ACC2Q6D9_9NEOP|nr:hypothetical protein PYW08_010262 [Mythimna loreyi]
MPVIRQQSESDAAGLRVVNTQLRRKVRSRDFTTKGGKYSNRFGVPVEATRTLRTMQPTVSPWAWVSSWDRRARTRAAGEFARPRDRAAARQRDHDKYAFYGLRKDSRHFIRLDPLAKGLLLNRQWVPTSAPVTWRVERAHHTEPWAVPGIKSIQSYRPFEPVPIVVPGDVRAAGPGAAGAPRPAPPGPHGWAHGARGWAAGAVVLALLVLLVRAAENCLHKKLFKAIYAHTNAGAAELQQNDGRPGHYRLQGVRRQESDEWSTPNVMATSLQLQHRDFDVGSLDNLDDMEDLPPLSHSDMPPPYSECARPAASASKLVREEPPPPYSACYVAYTGPKDAEPQVHIRRQTQNVLANRPHSSTDIDNAQNNLIENGLRSEPGTIDGGDVSEDVTPETRTELVFDNGRIVERLSSDSNETGAASNDNEEEQSTRHGKDRVVYVDETAAETSSPGRALLV